MIEAEVLEGRWELLSELGEDATGKSWLARDVAAGREVAFKALPDRLLHSRDGRIAFGGELQALIRLSHPRIREVVASGELQDGRPFYALTALPGRSLGDLGTLPAGAGRQLWIDALTALAVAHSRHNLHGGIEPASLRIAADGPGALVAFGLAGEAGLAPGSWRGDPAFAPPEAIRLDRLDPRADLFALGAMFFQTLTNLLPFGGPTGLIRDSEAAPASLQDIRADLPEDFAASVMATLAWDRGQRPPSAAACLEALGASPPEGAPAFLLEGPLVGRDTLVQKLGAALTAPLPGGAGLDLVYIAGQHGSGKTRALSALRGAAARAGLAAVQVDAKDFGPDPFATLLGAAGRLPGGVPEEKAALLSGDPGDLEPRLARDRCQAAWADLLAAEGRPAILLIDNAEAADEASKRMLAALRQRAGVPVRAVLAMTGTLPEGAQGHDLGPLGVEETAALAASALGVPEVPAGIAALLRERSGGRPLQIRRLLEDAAVRGALAFRAGTWRLPETLADFPPDDLALGRARVARLPAAARQVAEGLALLSGPQRLGRLGQWIGMEDAEVATSADALLASGLVAVAAGGGRLADSLAELALKADLQEDRRVRLHAGIAAGLDRLDLGDEAAIPLALHLEAAGGDTRTATVAARAGAFALQRGCVDLADTLIGLAERLGGAGSGESAAVLVLRAEQARSSGRYERAYTVFEKALDVLPQMANRPDIWGSRPQPTRARLLLAMADCRILAGRRADAIKILARAAEAARGDGDLAGSAVPLALCARLRLQEGNADAAKEAAEQALEAAGEAKAAGPRADAAQLLGELALKVPGASAEAMARLEEAREAREALGDLAGLAACEMSLAEVYLAVGQYTRAISAFERGVARSKALGLPEPARITLDLTLARACLELGDFGPALALARDVADLARKTDDRAAGCRARVLDARLGAALGRLSDAQASADEALSWARELADKPLEIQALQGSLAVQLALGQAKAAAETAKTGAELARAVGDTDRACAFDVAQAEAALAEEDSYRATTHLAAARGAIEKVADRATAGRLELMAARHAFDRRQDEAGKAFLAAAENIAKAAGLATLLVEIALVQAKVEATLDKGDAGNEAAARAFGKALKGAQELGMPLLAIQAARGLAAAEDTIQTQRGLAEARDATEAIAARLPAEQKEEFLKPLLGESGPDAARPAPAGAKADKQLADFARAFATAVGESGLLGRVLERILSLVGADRGAISLLGPDGQETSRVVRPQDATEDEAFAAARRSFVARCLKERQPVCEADARIDLRVPPALVKGLDLCSVACVPLRDGEALAGVLYVDRRSIRGTLGEPEMRLIEQLSGFAALALGHARRKEEREAHERLVEAVRRLADEAAGTGLADAIARVAELAR